MRAQKGLQVSESTKIFQKLQKLMQSTSLGDNIVEKVVTLLRQIEQER